MVIRDALIWGSNFLKQSGVESSDARVLLKYVLDFDDIKLSQNSNSKIDNNSYNKYCDFIKRRVASEPVSYITGIKEFMSLDFIVKPGVLIPRPETEHLVEYIIDKNIKNANILDICTGSGIIGISLAYYLENATVTAIDINPISIEVAKQNAQKHGVSDKVTILNYDAFDKYDFGEKFDVIASNPPYIKSNDIGNLQTDVALFEPHLALDGGDDGLMFYRSISKNAYPVLKDGGILIFEIGYDQADDICNILSRNYTDIKVIKDLAGLNRIVAAIKQNGDNK